MSVGILYIMKGYVPVGCSDSPANLDAFCGTKVEGQTLGVSLKELTATDPSLFAVEFDANDRGAKKAAVFASVDEGFKYLERINPMQRCFYEFLSEDAEKRLYFDVDARVHNAMKLHDPSDGSFKDIPKSCQFGTYMRNMKCRHVLQEDFSYETRLTSAQLVELYDEVEKQVLGGAFRFIQDFLETTYSHRIEASDVICMRATRHLDLDSRYLPKSEKFSYHLVVKQLTMVDVRHFQNDLKCFYRKHAVDGEHVEHVDCAPYGRNGVFRMLGCCKLGKQNHLIFDKRMNKNTFDFCQDLPPAETLITHFDGPTIPLPQLTGPEVTCSDVLRPGPSRIVLPRREIDEMYVRALEQLLHSREFFSQFHLGAMTSVTEETFYVQLLNQSPT